MAEAAGDSQICQSVSLYLLCMSALFVLCLWETQWDFMQLSFHKFIHDTEYAEMQLKFNIDTSDRKLYKLSRNWNV